MITRIFILEAHSITRAGLRAHLEAASDIHVNGEAADPQTALDAINRTKPGVVLVGAALYRQEGDRLIRRLLGVTPQPALLILADEEDAWAAERALKAGALGFVASSIEPAALVAAVRQVARQQVVVSPDLRNSLLRHLIGDHASASKDPSQALSEREMEVFLQTGQGLEAKEIAAECCISPRTVDVHRANIRNKLGIQGAHELMRFAMLWGQRHQDVERLRAFGRKASPLLLVEDDEVDILSVGRVLQELGVDTELIVTRTAEEALDYLRTPGKPRPGLVLLDIKMPGMDGREFLAAVRKDAALRSLPIVVLTASQLDEDKLRMHSLGITGYLAKSANPAEFAERLGLLARYWSVNEPPPAVPLPASAAAQDHVSASRQERAEGVPAVLPRNESERRLGVTAASGIQSLPHPVERDRQPALRPYPHAQGTPRQIPLRTFGRVNRDEATTSPAPIQQPQPAHRMDTAKKAETSLPGHRLQPATRRGGREGEKRASALMRSVT